MTNIGDVLRVSTIWRYNFGGDVINTQYLQVGAIPGSTPESLVLASCVEWVTEVYNGSGYTAAMCSLVRHKECVVHNVSDNTLIGHSNRVSLLDGTDVSECMPAQIAPLIVFYTSIPRFVGRKYLPPVGTDQVDDGHLAASLRSIIAAMVGVLIAPYETEDDITLRPIVASADLARIQIPITIQIRDEFADLGRRKLGRGS